jgi:hypothetical protein
MARIRPTARLTIEGGDTEATKTTPISKVMKRSGLVVREEEGSFPEKDSVNAEAENVVVEAGSNDEEDDGILSPSKPSHVEFGKSTAKAEDLIVIKKLGYFGENDDELIRFAGNKVIPEPKDDEVVVFKIFFRAGLQLSLYEMIGEVLKKFEIYLHQLTLNTIVRLSMYIWLCGVQERVSMPKDSVEFMNSTTRPR